MDIRAKGASFLLRGFVPVILVAIQAGRPAVRQPQVLAVGRCRCAGKPSQQVLWPQLRHTPQPSNFR